MLEAADYRTALEKYENEKKKNPATATPPLVILKRNDELFSTARFRCIFMSARPTIHDGGPAGQGI
jgi:hypothetical protein